MDPTTPAKIGVESVVDLTVYGPLGLITTICIVAVIVMYRDMRKERQGHQAEMKALEERYITKTEQNMEKYHVLAESMNRLLESVMKRYARSDSGGNHDGRTEKG